MNDGTRRFAGEASALLALLQQAVAGEQTTAGDVWRQIGALQDSYALDPVAMAAQLGGVPYETAARGVSDWATTKGSQPLDRGALAVDQLMRSIGVSTNLAGSTRPPSFYFPIAPDAQYKRQYKPGPPGTVLEVINLANVPMADWDMPGPSHRDANVTVRHMGDVEELVRSYVRQHPTSSMQLYLTPGGFRAWELGENHTAETFQPRFEELQVDPDYSRLSTNSSPFAWDTRTEAGEAMRIPLDPPGFRSRISHKPNRVDWVAQPLKLFQGAEAQPIPRSVELVRTLHDRPIAERYLQGGVSPEAMAVLQQQSTTASAALQAELRRRFRI